MKATQLAVFSFLQPILDSGFLCFPLRDAHGVPRYCHKGTSSHCADICEAKDVFAVLHETSSRLFCRRCLVSRFDLHLPFPTSTSRTHHHSFSAQQHHLAPLYALHHSLSAEKPKLAGTSKQHGHDALRGLSLQITSHFSRHILSKRHSTRPSLQHLCPRAHPQFPSWCLQAHPPRSHRTSQVKNPLYRYSSSFVLNALAFIAHPQSQTL